MDELKLKPCPFCGHEPELVETSVNCYVIRCTNHDWPSECKDTTIAGYVELCSWGIGSAAKDALIKAWNTRAGLACGVGELTPQPSPHGVKEADRG